jgi:hypothetical protein
MRAEIAIAKSNYMPEGKIALWKNGNVIWSGDIGSPIEDVDFDMVTFAPRDHERVMKDFDAYQNHPITKLIRAALEAARQNSK